MNHYTACSCPSLPSSQNRRNSKPRFNDVYVGPGKDGKFPAKSEGVPVSELSDASKDFVKKAIAAWTGDTPQGAEYRKLYARLSSIRSRSPIPARRT